MQYMSVKYRAFNDGISIQNVPDGYAAIEGDVVFDHLPTPQELNGAFSGYAAAKAALDLKQLVAATFAAGCQVVSPTRPEVNGTYAIDPAAVQSIAAIASGIVARNRLPGGGASFSFNDILGVPHVFDATTFLAFAEAIEDYVYALNCGDLPFQPRQIT